MSTRNRRRNRRPGPSQSRQDSPRQPTDPPFSAPSQADPSPAHPSRGDPSRGDPSQADPLLAVLLTLLTPLLTAGSAADAGRAAEQAVAAYRAGGQDQLVSIAQIIGFAVTSLDTLRLSMDADLSVPMKLRLRGNAAALSRSSHLATATLDNQRHEAVALPASRDDTADPPRPRSCGPKRHCRPRRRVRPRRPRPPNRPADRPPTRPADRPPAASISVSATSPGPGR